MTYLCIDLLYYFCRNLNEIFPNVTEQVVQDVKDSLQKHGLKPMAEETEKLLRNQILDISKPDHRIRQLISKYLI